MHPVSVTTTPDLLDGFVAREIALREPPAMPGANRATLVHHARPAEDAGSCVLYLPGFADYFFQAEYAQRWHDAGHAFYALDLRAQGRNLLGDRPPLAEYVPDLRIRNEEIEIAIGWLRSRHDTVFLVGHSMGGLQAVMYAYQAQARHRPEQPDALILNSPWLDLNENAFWRTAGTRAVAALARVRPRAVVAHLDPAYTEDLLAFEEGHWGIDDRLKPALGFPMRAATLATIRQAHRRVASGLGLTAPVLLCHAGKSGANRAPSAQELAGSDVVLGVADMIARAPRLGDNVELCAIEGGRHDLALSAQAVRETYLERSLRLAAGLAR